MTQQYDCSWLDFTFDSRGSLYNQHPHASKTQLLDFLHLAASAYASYRFAFFIAHGLRMPYTEHLPSGNCMNSRYKRKPRLSYSSCNEKKSKRHSFRERPPGHWLLKKVANSGAMSAPSYQVFVRPCLSGTAVSHGHFCNHTIDLRMGAHNCFHKGNHAQQLCAP